MTAFLDLTLRGDASRSVMQQLLKGRAKEDAWPEAFGTPATGKHAGAPAGNIGYWAGFQRRWALGLWLENAAAVNR